MLRLDSEIVQEEAIISNLVGETPMGGSFVPEIIHTNRTSNSVARFQNQAEKIEQWLHQYGFTYNPFQFPNSERDANLTRHFVEYPDFEKTLGLDDWLFFARTGDGKTATRLWLQSYYRDAVSDHNAFAFSYLIPQEIALDPPSDISGHVEAILTAAVRHAFVFFALRGVDLPNLQDDQQAAALAHEFAVYFDEYYGLLNSWREDLQQALADYSLHQVIRNLSPVYDELEVLETGGSVNPLWLKRWLHLLNTPYADAQHTLTATPLQRWQRFCALIQATGMPTILILVDGVDVKPSATRAAAALVGQQVEQLSGQANIVDHMESIIHPLLAVIADKTLGKQLIWKLFLPTELYLPLSTLLSKSINHAILFWDNARLRQLLKFRLNAATNNTVSTLLQLSEADVPLDLETFLIVQSF